MRCASCDIEITTEPVTVDGRTFCCRGCADGGPCGCGYEDGFGRYPRNGHPDPLVVSDPFEDTPS